MEIHVNGEARTCESVRTVAELLHHLGRGGAPCAVEVNQKLVPKSQHPAHPLKDGDRVELVTLVGGG
ncbi:MAG: sulfur carrier protein ThiS [Planctomycetes bacterium]|nr:sulfur carrier protein ThiS [Planctomycetota bacterium]